MQNGRLKRIAALLAAAAVLLSAPVAFAAEKLVAMAQAKDFPGFDRDNAIVLNDLVIWQTSDVSKKPLQKEAIYKLVQDDSGQYYLDVGSFGRVEVRPLKLVVGTTQATHTVALEAGRAAELTGGGKWRLRTAVPGKKLRKGDHVIIAYDGFDKLHRMISWDDTWQCEVEKE